MVDELILSQVRHADAALNVKEDLLKMWQAKAFIELNINQHNINNLFLKTKGVQP